MLFDKALKGICKKTLGRQGRRLPFDNAKKTKNEKHNDKREESAKEFSEDRKKTFDTNQPR